MSDSENGVLRSHLVRVACRRNRVASDPEKEREIIDILSIHDKDIENLGRFRFSGIIADTLAFLKSECTEQVQMEAILKPITDTQRGDGIYLILAMDNPSGLICVYKIVKSIHKNI